MSVQNIVHKGQFLVQKGQKVTKMETCVSPAPVELSSQYWWRF